MFRFFCSTMYFNKNNFQQKKLFYCLFFKAPCISQVKVHQKYFFIRKWAILLMCFLNFKMRLTKNYEHVMCILKVTEGDGLHNHSCSIARERKEKNDWFWIALSKYCTLPNMSKKINWRRHIKQKFSVPVVDTEIKGLK